MIYNYNLQQFINIIIILLINNSREQELLSNIQTCGSPLLKKCDTTDECFQLHKFCDGEIHCSDGSDETNICRLYAQCGKTHFQCKYGGCISKIKKCDGKPDCIDKSDEDDSLCNPNNTVLTANTSTSACPHGYFECTSGACIKAYEVCDGKFDCEDDQSDETPELCQSQTCTKLLFKCQYGGCISKFKKCNGINDCVDGSDETLQLCGKRTSQVPKPFDTKTGDKCYVPDIPNLIMYKGPAGIGIRLKPGDIVQPFVGSFYSYSCDDNLEVNYENQQSYHVYCSGNETYSAWTKPNHPSCTKFCDGNQLYAITFNAKCNGKRNDCIDKKWLIGTEAKLSCNFGYTAPNNFMDTLKCNQGGKWSHEPISCIAKCGKLYGDLVPYISGGQNLSTLTIPWHAAIYRNDLSEEKTEIYNFICGGTIISEKLILTAAHCFWNEDAGALIDASEFKIAVGKTKRSYFAPEKYVKKFSVSKIIKHESFSGKKDDYTYDIALGVVEDPIIFNAFASPVCINYNVAFNERGIQSGINGLFSGMGDIAGKTFAETLQIANVTTLSHDDCKIGLKAAQNFPADKFCLDYSNTSSAKVCFGDSGGGFVQKQIYENESKYYLLGVLSSGHYAVTCGDGQGIAGFTNIQIFDYIGLINNTRKETILK